MTDDAHAHEEVRPDDGLDELDRLVLSEYPHPIAVTYQWMLSEQDWEKKTRTATRVFEFTMRTMSLVLASQFLLRDLSADGLADPWPNQGLVRRLSRATLGTWSDNLFDILKAYEGKRDRMFMPELYDLYWDASGPTHTPRKGVRGPFARLVEIRNDVEHGLPPKDDAGWEALYEEVSPLLRQVLCYFSFLEKYDLIHIRRTAGAEYWYDLYTGLRATRASDFVGPVDQVAEGWVYLCKERAQFLQLHPLLVFWEAAPDEEHAGLPGDVAIFDRYRSDSLDYLALGLWRKLNLTDPSLLSLVQEVIEAYARLTGSHRKAQALTWDVLKDTAYEVSSRRLGDVRDSRHHDAYLQRSETRQLFGDFLESDRTCLVLVGPSGVGKTSFFLSLMDEYEDSPDVCVLTYDGRRLSAEQDLADTLGRDFEPHLDLPGLAESGSGALLARISAIEGINRRKVVLLIDAINENPNAIEVLRRIDAFVDSVRYPWLKVAISSRPESWRTISRDLPLAEHRYYHGEIPVGGGRVSELPVTLEPFGPEELSAAYNRYRASFNLQTEYEALSPAVRHMLRDPFTLRLVAETWEGSQIPPAIAPSSLIDEYVQALLRACKVQREDIRFLKQELLPLMIGDGPPVNAITAKVINEATIADGRPLFDLIHNNYTVSTGRRVNQSYANLADAGILVERGGPLDYEIGFGYERFWDHFGGERLFSLLRDAADPDGAYRAIVLSIDDHPFMWGVLVNALVRALAAGDDGILLTLAASDARDCRDLAATVLLEYAQQDPARVQAVLDALYPPDANRRMRPPEENQALVAVEVAGKLPAIRILEQGLAADAQRLRDHAVIHSYELWRADRQAGFGILERLTGRIGLGSLLSARGLVETSGWLSMLIFMGHFDEPGVMLAVQRAWRPAIERILLYSPGGARTEAFKGPLRQSVLRSIAGLVWRQWSGAPDRYTVMNPGELEAFYRLPQSVKDKALALTAFLDPEYYDMPLLEQSLLDLFRLEVDGAPLNNMLLKLVIDYALVAQGLRHLDEVLTLVKKMACKELALPGDTKRAMWGASWVHWALATLQPEVDDRLFADYTELAWRCNTEVRHWRGALGQHAYIGHDQYTQIFVKKHRHHDVALLRELMDWAIQSGAHQLIRDLLEHYGYIANSPNWPAVLPAVEPLLAALSMGHHPDGTDRPVMADDLEAKTIEVLASAWSRGRYRTEEFLERLNVPRSVRDEIYVNKGDPRVIARFGKGLPWLRFLVTTGYSPRGCHEMLWIARTAIQARSFRHFFLQAGQKAINILYGDGIFPVGG